MKKMLAVVCWCFVLVTQPSWSQSEAPTPFVLPTVDEYCDRIINDPLTKKMVEISKAGNASSWEKLSKTSMDGLLRDWLAGKQVSGPFISENRSFFTNNRTRETDYSSLVVGCMKKVVAESPQDVTLFQVIFPTQLNFGPEPIGWSFIQMESENRKAIANAGTRRVVDDNGNVKEEKVIPRLRWDTGNMAKKMTDNYYGKPRPVYFDVLTAFMLPNGSEVMKKLYPKLSEKLDMELESFKREGEAKEEAQVQRAAAMVAQEAAKTAELAEREAKFERIRTGKQEASSCVELAEALNASSEDSPLIQANGENRYILAKLEKYDVSNGQGMVRQANTYKNKKYSSISTNPQTRWINKNQIKIDGLVQIVGRYSANKDIMLVSGASETIQHLDVVCMGP